MDEITLFIQRKECWTHAGPAAAPAVKPPAAAVAEHAARTQHSPEPDGMLQCSDTRDIRRQRHSKKLVLVANDDQAMTLPKAGTVNPFIRNGGCWGRNAVVVAPTAEPAVAPTAELAATTMEHVVAPAVEPAAVPTVEPTTVPTEGPVTASAVEPAAPTTVGHTAAQAGESGAAKRARTHTEEDEGKPKKMRVDGGDGEQHMEHEGYVTVDEQRSVMAKMFGDEKDNTQTPADVPHPYAGCNNSNTQHSAGSLDALLNASDDEYDAIL